MQDAVKSHNLHQICHKRWNKRTITTEHHGFHRFRVMLALFTRRFTEKL
jgi:hypothetical protein